MARIIAEKADVIPVLAEIFRKHGYEGASISIIAAGTGLGRSSLYHFFPDGKKDMAAAVLGHISEWFERSVFDPLDHLPPKAGIAQMLNAVTDYFDEGRRICLVGAFALDTTRDQFSAEIRTYFERWISSLENCLARGKLSDKDAAAEARRIVATIQGGIVLARATGDERSFHDLITQLRAIAGD